MSISAAAKAAQDQARQGNGQFGAQAHREQDDDLAPRVHATVGDLIEREIKPALGEHAGDYDLDAMVADLKERGLVQHVDFPGQAQRNGFVMQASEDEFWDAASRAERQISAYEQMHADAMTATVNTWGGQGPEVEKVTEFLKESPSPEQVRDWVDVWSNEGYTPAWVQLRIWAGRNVAVADAVRAADDALDEWNDAGRPHTGPVAEKLDGTTLDVVLADARRSYPDAAFVYVHDGKPAYVADGARRLIGVFSDEEGGQSETAFAVSTTVAEGGFADHNEAWRSRAADPRGYSLAPAPGSGYEFEL